MQMKISSQTVSDEAIELIAARFRAMGEASRLKWILAVEHGEKNVSQLVVTTGLSQPNASRHLQTLTDAGILTRRRERMSVFYTIADPTICRLYKQVYCSVQKRLTTQANTFRQQAKSQRS
jgi:DNA-binding transcriptional ArsR family regulator